MLTPVHAPTCRPPAFPRRSSFPLPVAVRAAAFALAAIAPLAARGQSPALPPLGVLVKADGESEWSEEILAISGFGFVRCTAPPDGAGAWYRAVTNAVVSDPTYFSEGGLQGLAAAEVDLGDVLGYTEFEYGIHAQSYVGPSWRVLANSGALYDVLARLLLEGPTASPTAVFSGGALLPWDETSIAHDYNQSANHDWLTHAGTGAFNLDALRQQAVWQQVADEVAPMQQDEFFASPRYAATLKYLLDVNVTLIGVRSSVLVPGPEMPAQPSIAPYPDPYPFALPKLTTSGVARIRFGGAGSGVLAFVPPGQFLPIFSVAAGLTFVLPAAGYQPNMQALLAASGLPDRYVLSPTWAGYGKIGLPIPCGIHGVHVVTHYRYQQQNSTEPVWGPWHALPAAGQPHFFVHP